MKKITVYGKPNCHNCDMTKRFLKSKEIDFEYIDVTIDQGALDAIRVHGYQQLPVVSVDNFANHFGGYNPASLVKLAYGEEL